MLLKLSFFVKGLKTILLFGSLSMALMQCANEEAQEAEGSVQVPAAATEFARLMNEHRDTKCSSSLTWNNEIFKVAQAHSQDMKDRNFFAHNNPDGKTPSQRLTDAGISWSAAAENIAQGQSTAQAVLTAWLNSTGHKANIENCTYTEHGVGYVADGHYWTHQFRKP